jgi:hypothetical protein
MMMMRGGTMMDCQELSKKKRKFFYGRDCGREKIMMEFFRTNNILNI